MEATLRKFLEIECQKLISRHQSHIRRLKRYQERFQKRTGRSPGTPKCYRPDHWDLNAQFDPYYVRSRIFDIAHGLTRSIRAEAFTISPAYCFPIPKPGGGKREVTIFTIPDSAVAHYLYRELLRRNGHRFSSYSFAYRPDRTSHFAVEHLSTSIRHHERLFVLEYDFAKYFDTISHDYLERLLKDNLQVSPREQALIKRFLEFPKAQGREAFAAGKLEMNKVGIAQGSSLSLFLANAACLELDRELEATGATFARYADDTVILCREYEQATTCAELMLSHGRRSATKINLSKSDGISLLTAEKDAEIRAKSSFPFLGYEISRVGVGLSTKAVKRIKRRISTIIHRHLLLYPKSKLFNPARIEVNGIDWDMVTCINEIRRYLYGHLTEETLKRCLTDKSEPLVLTKGLLSYYPLIDQPQALQDLDGWLVNVLHRAQVQRRKFLKKSKVRAPIYAKSELIDGKWYLKQSPPNETQLPSFWRAWRYTRKCLQIYGLMSFPSSYYPEYSQA